MKPGLNISSSFNTLNIALAINKNNERINYFIADYPDLSLSCRERFTIPGHFIYICLCALKNEGYIYVLYAGWEVRVVKNL